MLEERCDDLIVGIDELVRFFFVVFGLGEFGMFGEVIDVGVVIGLDCVFYYLFA